MRAAFWYRTLVVPSLLASCCSAVGADKPKAFVSTMPQSPVRSGLNARKGPVLASANDDQEASTKGIKLAARGGASSPGRGVASTARGKVAVYDMAVGLLTLVALAGSYTLLDGVVERTMGATSVLCTGLALSAYGETITSFVKGGAQTTSELDKAQQKEFSSFQRNFLVVQLVATFVDFIQGPYLYKVYESYGYSMADIATLYLVGFGSSALTSPFAGLFADKYGRRTGCMAYTLLLAVSVALLHVNQFWPLVLGRFISGVATSFLTTCYECWMVSEHNRRGFPGSLLGSTFSAYVFLMGLVAVASGTVAGFAEKSNGVLAPFQICAGAALLNFVMLPIMWRPDNYGDNTPTKAGEKSKTALSEIYKTFFGGKAEVFWVGLTQVCFEVAMFTWIFMWTPALDTGEIANLNLGNVFATFMIGVMIGSSSFKILTGNYWKLSTEAVLLGALVLGTASLAFSAYNTQASLLINAFVIYEAVVGIYFAAMGTIRAKFVPEGQRATIMNVMRLVLNVFVVIMLWGPIGLDLPMDQKKPLVLGISALFLLVSCFSQSRLLAAISSTEKDRKQ